MKKANEFVAGLPSEVLSVTGGCLNDTPVGIVTIRYNPHVNLSSISFMFDRSNLERLAEDIAYILNRSTNLATGKHRDPMLSLAEIEALDAAVPIPREKNDGTADQ